MTVLCHNGADLSGIENILVLVFFCSRNANISVNYFFKPLVLQMNVPPSLSMFPKCSTEYHTFGLTFADTFIV